MFTWSEDDKTLFSCDFLGCHYCEPGVLDTNVVYDAKYKDAFRGYFDAIFGPFKPYVLNGLKKMESLDIDFLCTSHGPVLTKDRYLNYAKESYAQWASAEKPAGEHIPIFFCTAYGNTKVLAEAIKKGVLTVKPEAHVELYDIIENDMGALAEKLNDSDAFLIGTPTINRDALPPVMELLAHVDGISSQKKTASAFGSYGWSGEGVPAVLSRMKLQRIKIFGDGLRINFVPSADEIIQAESFGAEFAKSL